MAEVGTQKTEEEILRPFAKRYRKLDSHYRRDQPDWLYEYGRKKRNSEKKDPYWEHLLTIDNLKALHDLFIEKGYSLDG